MCKELGLWALLWVGVLTSAWGQGHGFRMGLAMDPNISWMNSRDFEHTTDGGRAHFGYQFMADIMFSETYAFGTGVHVFRTGSQIDYWEPTTDSTLSRVSRDFNNQYVELPLTFKFRTKEIGYTTYFGRFGTGLGLNTRRAAEEVRYVDVMASSALGEDDVTEVLVEGLQLAISRVGGMLYAIDNTCPHAGAALSDGDLDGRNLLCPDHGWSFDLATGACAIDPSSSVNAYRIRQRDGRIEVALTTGDVAASVGSR